MATSPEPIPAPIPAPTPGSHRYFVLLYAPAAYRGALAGLLAVADEIGAGLARRLDHELAHARLDWWRRELEQHRAGLGRHPTLRALRATASPAATAAPLELQPLLEAATLDLAESLRDAGRGERLRRATFVQAAQLLGATDLSSAQRKALGALGALTLAGECDPASIRRSGADTAVAEPLAQLGAPLQPRLAPLLVWVALALAHARRPGGAGNGKSRSLRDGIADNMLAWKVARRAARGTLTLR